MTIDEFVNKNAGRRVRIKASYLEESNWAAFIGWEGEVLWLRNPGGVWTKTTTTEDKRIPIGREYIWQTEYLEVIDELPEIIVPENHHLCPRCNKETCKGLDLLDCVRGKYQ